MMLFECFFNDATYLVQTPADQSISDPSKNAFFDVQQRIQDVSYFSVRNGHCVYGVDLTDGSFIVNGTRFNVDGVRAENLELIYFKRNRLLMYSNGDSVQLTEYHIGWKGLVDGTEVRKTIAIENGGYF